MANFCELAESAFAPGNLILGCSLKNISSYIEQGIRPPLALGARSLATSKNICFSILPTTPLPDRYSGGLGRHYAPGGKPGGHSLGIIVSREALIAQFPDQLFAVGKYFLEAGYREKLSDYAFDSQANTIFGIKIRQPFTDLVFNDEVRLYPANVFTAAIKPELWTGLVVESYHIRNISMFMKEASTDLEIPVFLPDCNVASNDVRKLARNG